MDRASRRLAHLAVIAGLTIAACGGGQTSQTASPPAVATAGGASAAPTTAPVVSLKTASFGSISDAPFFIAIEQGYFKAEGLDVELVPSQNAAQGLTFLGAGQVDAAGLAPTPGLFNAIADGIKLKIVADKSRIDAKHSYVALAVRKPLIDSGAIRSVKDLKGKKVGLSGLETGTGAELHLALKEAGLTIDDITVVNGNPPDGYAGLKNGALDAAVLQEPFLAQALADGSAQVLRLLGEVVPNAQQGVLVFGEKLLGNEALAARYVRAFLKGIADFNAAFPSDGSAPKGRAEIVAMCIKYTTVKDPALYDKMFMPLFAADGAIDTASIDKFQQFFIDRKLQKKFIPASDYYTKIATK